MDKAEKPDLRKILQDAEASVYGFFDAHRGEVFKVVEGVDASGIEDAERFFLERAKEWLDRNKRKG